MVAKPHRPPPVANARRGKGSTGSRGGVHSGGGAATAVKARPSRRPDKPAVRRAHPAILDKPRRNPLVDAPAAYPPYNYKALPFRGHARRITPLPFGGCACG